jgi:hypothetical protein
MKHIKQIIFIILTLGCFCGCNPDKKAKQQVNENPRPIVVKGLNIGMSVQELSEIVRTKLGAPWKIDRTDDPRQINILNDDLDNKQIELIGAHDSAAEKFDVSIHLWLDADDKVEQILIGENCCGRLFGSQDLSAKDFVQVFIDAYGIDEMKRAVTEHNLQCWEYTSLDNVRVRIFPDKTVNIAKIAGKSEVHKNFN